MIQVLPFTASDHAGTDGAIAIFEFADAGTVAYTECYGGGRIAETHDEVADLVTVVSMLRASALPRDESRELMRKVSSEIDEHRSGARHITRARSDASGRAPDQHPPAPCARHVPRSAPAR